MSYEEPRAYTTNDPTKMFRRMGVKWVQEQIVGGKFEGSMLDQARTFVEYACQRANLRWVVIGVVIAVLGLLLSIGLFFAEQSRASGVDHQPAQATYESESDFGSS